MFKLQNPSVALVERTLRIDYLPEYRRYLKKLNMN